jgi:hypothetical protein
MEVARPKVKQKLSKVFIGPKRKHSAFPWQARVSNFKEAAVPGEAVRGKGRRGGDGSVHRFPAMVVCPMRRVPFQRSGYPCNRARLGIE